MTTIYNHHRVSTEPLQWQAVADEIRQKGAKRIEAEKGVLYGIWRSQIGRPRDELIVMTAWSNNKQAERAQQILLLGINSIIDCESESMKPTLRPLVPDPPRRQGNYAFRWFHVPKENWEEFLDLCVAAWPGFESSYDSQVIGLWQLLDPGDGIKQSLLLTRRPNLAMWERSKIPQGEKEKEVRRMLSRRYDLCDWTCVYTTTLLTAVDRKDEIRWT